MRPAARVKYVLAGLIPRYRPGFESGSEREIRSSESGHVCYRINIRDSQLSPSSMNLIPAQAGKVTVGLASHWPCVTTRL